MITLNTIIVKKKNSSKIKHEDQKFQQKLTIIGSKPLITANLIPPNRPFNFHVDVGIVSGIPIQVLATATQSTGQHGYT